MGNTESKPSDGGLIREGDSNRGAEGNRSYGYFNVIRNMSDNYIQNYRLRTEIREATDKIVSLNNKTHELEEWFNQRFDHARGLQMQADDLLEQQGQIVKYDRVKRKYIASKNVPTKLITQDSATEDVSQTPDQLEGTRGSISQALSEGGPSSVFSKELAKNLEEGIGEIGITSDVLPSFDENLRQLLNIQKEIADTMNQTRTEAQIHMKNLSLHTEVNQLYKRTKGVPEDSTEVSLFRNSSLHTKAQYVPTNATRKEFEKTEKKNWEEFEKDKTRIEEEMLYIRNGTASLSDF